MPGIPSFNVKHHVQVTTFMAGSCPAMLGHAGLHAWPCDQPGQRGWGGGVLSKPLTSVGRPWASTAPPNLQLYRRARGQPDAPKSPTFIDKASAAQHRISMARSLTSISQTGSGSYVARGSHSQERCQWNSLGWPCLQSHQSWRRVQETVKAYSE